MQYWGKFVMLILGLLSGVGLWGIVLILILDYLLNKISFFKEKVFFVKNQSIQKIFFNTTFQVMGHLTKSKGYVTETDIKIASLFMDRMQLQGHDRKIAQHAFREGKERDYPLRNKLYNLRMACFNRFDLIQKFLEIQIQVALSNGLLHPKEHEILYVIAEELGISRIQLNHFLNMIKNGGNFNNSYHHYSNDDNLNKEHSLSLEEAYNILDVKDSDNNHIIKRSYLKMMSKYHPDKLIAKGLSAEMMEKAKQKAQEIQAAYDLIRKEKINKNF